MNTEYIVNNAEFKAAIRSLKKKYPFILGFEFPSNIEQRLREYQTVIPIKLVISMDKIKEFYPDWIPLWYVEPTIEREGKYDAIYVSSAWDTSENNEPRELEETFIKDVERVQKNNVLPRQHKLRRRVIPTTFVYV
jgi:hypothetical protein